jgi:endonuclease/exonuclease/phosphatase (EEP) superfamily protein YafD
MGIFSRYPLTPLAVTFKLQPGWQLQVARVQVGERSFILYNCHPRSTNIFLFLRGLQTGSKEVASSFQVRRQFTEKLLADIARRTEPILLLGDFNSPPNSDVHKLLLTRFADTHWQAGWGFGHTFPAIGGRAHGVPILSRMTRIDMLLYSPEFVALRSHVGIPSSESDHLPVMATLAWPQRSLLRRE